MATKQYATAARVATNAPSTPANRTPAPATRKGHITSTPPARVVAPVVGITAAAPLAVPVAPTSAGSPFSDFDPTEETTTSRGPRRRRKRGSWWKGPVLALAVLVIAGIVAIANWDRIVALLPPMPGDEQVAQDDKNKDPIKEPVRKTPGKKSATTAPIRDKSKTNDRPKNNPPKNNPPKKDPSKNPSRMTNHPFPRRALVVSVHDYLYANPIHDGMHIQNAVNIDEFIRRLSGTQDKQDGKGFKIPLNQVAHLSDEASPRWKPRAPTKSVIEKTLTHFLASSRAQDRIMVFFIGHSVELGDDVFLAPIEGELDNAATLIPLKWLYEQLAKCKARQKVLVLDVNRYNQTFGQERPGSGEMGPKLDAMLQSPPAGVQVLSSCIAKQKSYETDDSPVGVFLDAWYEAFTQKQPSGKIQRDDDPLPLERYVPIINEVMKKELGKRKLEQVCRLTGKAVENEATFDKNEPPPPDAFASLAAAPVEVAENKTLIESVLDQVGTPPVKVTHEMALHYDALPPFSADMLKKYEGDKPNPESPLRKAVKNARATLWAIYPGAEPKEVSGEVGPIRARVKVKLDVLRDGYRAPAGGNAEKQFKARVEGDERAVAKMISAIRDALEELEAKDVVEAKDNENTRWKANYDFMLARIQMEYAYLYEYQSMLGSMRKEFPPRDAELHGGWKLASQVNLQGDSAGKKLASKARKLLDKIAKDHAGTPWEVLAKREKLTNLGLEWQATR